MTNKVTGDETLTTGVAEKINSVTEIPNNDATGSDNVEGKAPRKRGPYKPREKKGDAPKKRGGEKISVGVLATQLQLAHMALAGVTRIEELALSNEEAQTLAKACIEFSEQHGVVISGKAAATIQLILALTGTYGPRLFAYKMRKNAERRANSVEVPEALRDQVEGLQ